MAVYTDPLGNTVEVPDEWEMPEGYKPVKQQQKPKPKE